MRNPKLYAILFFFLVPILAFAQGKKPEVLVYGNGMDAYTAAIQSAKSNLNTVWVLEIGHLREMEWLKFAQADITSFREFHNGFWANLLTKSRKASSASDSVIAVAIHKLNPQLLFNALEEELLQYPHLSVIYRAELKSVKKSGKKWEVKLQSNVEYKVRAIVDATPEGKVGKMAVSEPVEYLVSVEETKAVTSGKNPLLRTAIALHSPENERVMSLPLGAIIQLLPEDKKGKKEGLTLFYTQNHRFLKNQLPSDANALPLLGHLGQSVGALAAYVAFFKTTPDKVEVRQVQGEVLQYGARVIPFEDIKIEDPNFLAIQKNALTGLFAEDLNEKGQLVFQADSSVKKAEIQPILEALYSRSQIWFEENNALEELKLKDVLSLIKYISARGNELESIVERNWTRKFKFTTAYDIEKVVTRREVATLLEEYCKPFDVRVNLKGQIVR